MTIPLAYIVPDGEGSKSMAAGPIWQALCMGKTPGHQLIAKIRENRALGFRYWVLCGTEKVPDTRPEELEEGVAADLPSTVDRPVVRSMTSRPPVSRFDP